MQLTDAQLKQKLIRKEKLFRSKVFHYLPKGKLKAACGLPKTQLNRLTFDGVTCKKCLEKMR